MMMMMMMMMMMTTVEMTVEMKKAGFGGGCNCRQMLALLYIRC